MQQKKGIALLVTLFFITLISLSVGIGFKYIKSATKSVKVEKNLLQNFVIVDDVVTILKNAPELQDLNSSEDFAQFLNETSVIPFQSKGFDIVINLSSARSKINPNIFKDTKILENFKIFLQNSMVNPEYANMLADLVSGMKANSSYNSNIFDEHPELYRDGIVSFDELDTLNDIYKQKYHDNDIDKLDMQELFYIDSEGNGSIDLNFATSQAWQIMLGCNETRAQELVSNGMGFNTLEEFGLSPTEVEELKKFQYSFNEEILDVKIYVHGDVESFIRFEYNIKTKRESNFVFKI